NIEFQTGPALITLAQPISIKRTKAVGIGNSYYDWHHIEPLAKAWQTSIGFRTDIYDGWNFSAYYVLSQVWRKAELETFSSSIILFNQQTYRVKLPMQFGHAIRIGV
ncbi:hypothetical protein RZS08_02520, partial [Arthrospira platensis SPKY1]|nr:hypothetical protein [Arthrospira platensis SPKY1]